jgi:hypothetical protein
LYYIYINNREVDIVEKESLKKTIRKEKILANMEVIYADYCGSSKRPGAREPAVHLGFVVVGDSG